MCGCSTHQPQSCTTTEPDPNAVTVKVEDMTCGHCAGTIKSAIESSIPGTKVTADPEARLVSVEGAADLAQVSNIITVAGYTPTAAHA